MYQSYQQILDIINGEDRAYYTGNRIILPFKCQLLKVIADSRIYSDFAESDDIKVVDSPKNTSMYLHETGRLFRFEGGHKLIKMVLAPFDADLCDRSQHIKMVCQIEDNHQVDLRLPGKDDLFIG